MVTYCSIALQLGSGASTRPRPSRWPASRAAPAARRGPPRELLEYADRLLAIGQEAAAADPEKPFAAVPAALLALTLAGTPEAGVPDVPV